MTKQELEKAIEKGESVWYLFTGVYELKTSEHTDKFITRNSDYCYTDENGVDRCAPLDMLYKSKEEAEHYLNHQDITRTETLPFLTWEEFLEKKAIHFIDNKGIDFVLRITDNKIKLMVFFMVSKTWDLTEANFYKAYDECVRLFRR